MQAAGAGPQTAAPVPTAARRLSGASTRRRPTAEPAPKPRKTDADTEMSTLEAEPAAFPLKNPLRKTSASRSSLEIGTFSAKHEFDEPRLLLASLSACRPGS